MGILDGKYGVVFGVANKRSIAWAIAQTWAKEGAKLAFTYQGERLKENVEELVETFGADVPLIKCDVTADEDVNNVFKEIKERFGTVDLICTLWLMPRGRLLKVGFLIQAERLLRLLLMLAHIL
jgi:enoyl-[acyl-carrier protein] reductase I